MSECIRKNEKLNHPMQQANISFTSDIMCNKAQNEACKTRASYNYNAVFKQVKHLLQNCDYCVGNLETPFDGENAGFSEEMYSFNTPDLFAVNLFQPQETLPGSIHLLNNAEQIAKEVEELYLQHNMVYEEKIKRYLAQLEKDIHNCRKGGADFVFMIMQSEGQYNPVPDAYTEYLVKKIGQTDTDMIIGHHPHVVHKFEYKNGNFPVAYSLGNFAFTPEQSPESCKNPISNTGLVFNVELKKKHKNTEISQLSFSVTRSTIQKDGKAVVVPMFDLINETNDKELCDNFIEDNQYVVNTFLGYPLDSPVRNQKDYKIK